MSDERCRYVITPDVALSHAADQSLSAEGVGLVAPALIRSQVLSTLYGMVRSGEMSEADAKAALSYVRGLRMRLLGDRVLQDVAWRIAAELDMPDKIGPRARRKHRRSRCGTDREVTPRPLS